MDKRTHWNAVYREKGAEGVSWYQRDPRLSLEIITRAVPDLNARIIDVGGGASTLVDRLLAHGYANLTVLDLSREALDDAAKRLGKKKRDVRWVEADVLTAELPPRHFDLWHDRAAFHFLTVAADRRRYIEQVRNAMKSGGHVLIATFAEDGPPRCSGLEVVRYSPESLHEELGADFELVSSVRETHITPSGKRQAFIYCLCRFES